MKKYNVYIIDIEGIATLIGKNLRFGVAYIKVKNTDRKLKGTLNISTMVEVGSKEDLIYSK